MDKIKEEGYLKSSKFISIFKKNISHSNLLATHKEDKPMINRSIYNYLPQFEKIKKREEQARQNIFLLEAQDDDELLDLLIKLENCEVEDRCRSGACPVCVSITRADLILSALEVIDTNQEWCMITVIYFNSEMSDEDMSNFRIEKLKNRLHKQLERCQFDAPVIGSFEIDYHESSQKWLPHFHLLTPNNQRNIKRLRQYFRQNRAMKISIIKNRPEQISYAFKFYWGRMYEYKFNGKTRKDKAGLKQKQLLIALLKQDEFGVNGQLFLHLARRRGTTFKFASTEAT